MRLKETRLGYRRHATLQVCVFMNGDMRCKPRIIFSGKEKSQKPRQEEGNSYDKMVDVIFNEAAWADESTMISGCGVSTAKIRQEEPQLLEVDAFLAHLTRGVREELKKLRSSGS